MTRRTVLRWSAVAGITGMSGCRYDLRRPDRTPDPDTVLRDRTVAGKRALLASYDATARQHPELRTRLAPLRADHAAHLAALGAPEPAATGSATPTWSATGSATASPTPVPADPRAAVRALVAAEATAAALRVRDCVAAASPDLARLLAAIGGCEAAHTALLRGGSA